MKFLILILAFPVIALAERQAISKSLVDCSLIYEITGDAAELRGKPSKTVEKFRKASNDFYEEAKLQANKEGQSENYIERVLRERSAHWNNKFDSATSVSQVLKGFEGMEEIKDWMSYCRSLAKSRGLKTFK